MNIGIVIGRIGDVDGVALETEKWIKVLRGMGHEIFILSGRFKERREHTVSAENVTLMRPLSFFSPECEWEQNRAFFFPPDEPDELLAVVHGNARRVATAIFRWVLENKIDVILSENASALPCHLSMGLGIKMAVEHMSLPIVTHDHDFAWERGDRYESPFREITELVENSFPLRSENARHAVINSTAKRELMERYGIDATVVPNVMDFDKPFAQKDEVNAGLLRDIGIQDTDIPLFQITRIVERKGIEVAIDLVKRIEDRKVKLVITGSAADDERKGYFKILVDRIQEYDLGDRVVFAYHKILSHREVATDESPIYSLSDAYAQAVACTYFSTYEGFGNAFIETILARKPIFVNNYKPVFWPDIGSKGFQTVMLEDNVLTDAAVNEIDRIIHDPELQREITEHNFELGKKLFSYDVLQEKLEALFDLR